MNCRDFDQAWNQLLDDEPPSRWRDDAATRLDLESRLRQHADICADCRERHRGFESLRLALRAWSARPEAPAALPPLLTDRVLRADAPAAPGRRRPRAVAALAAAAALVVAILTLKPSPPPDAEIKAPSTASATIPESGLLRAAVNNATAASWQLAQLTAEPVARLGRDMIDASLPAEEPPSPVLEIALLEPASTDSDSFAPEFFSRVGGYLTAGVQPVSTSAREAFGFLRPPTPR